LPCSRLGNGKDATVEELAAPVHRDQHRAGHVAGDLLRGAGFDAVSVAGGTGAWARSGRPLEGGLA
jgi:hypothetical protein